MFEAKFQSVMPFFKSKKQQQLSLLSPTALKEKPMTPSPQTKGRDFSGCIMLVESPTLDEA